MKRRRRGAAPDEVVALVGEVVARLADEYRCTEVDAVRMLALALARVGGEVAAESVAGELRGLLGF